MSPDPTALTSIGGVGTGFTERTLRELEDDLVPHARDDSPFARPLIAAEPRDPHFVGPVLVGEVTYAEWTGDGYLRHPAGRGLRPDKSSPDVVREDRSVKAGTKRGVLAGAEQRRRFGITVDGNPDTSPAPWRSRPE